MPEAPQLKFTADLTVTLGDPLVVGPTPRGLHRIIPITGGSVEGPKLRGVILPGGADWQYIDGAGTTEVDARYTLRTGEGVLLGVTSRGIRTGPPEVLASLARGEEVDPASYYFRTAVRIEAPVGIYDWMARAIFLAQAERLPYTVRIRLWQVC